MRNSEKTKEELLKEISELKQKLNNRKNEYNQYEHIVQKANDAIMIVRHGVIIFVNDYLKSKCGYSSEDLLGKAFLRFVAEDSREMVQGFYKKILMENLSENNYKAGIILNDKSILPVEVASSVIDFEGEKAVLSIMRDISEREKSLKHITESEEKYRSIFENTNDLIQSVDANGNFIFVNPAWKDKFGYSEEDIKNLNLFTIIHPEQIKHCKGEYYKVLSGAKSKDVKTVCYTKSGNEIMLEGNITPLIIKNKVEGIHAFFHDVTERNLAEKSLAETNLYLQTVFNNSLRTIIVATDSNGLITVFNAGAEQMLGYTGEEIVGKQTPGLFHLKSELIAREKELSKEFGRTIQGFEVFKAPVIGGGYDEREWTFVRKDGSHLTVNLIVTAVESEKGEIMGVIGFAQDITEKTLAKQELKESEEKYRLIIETAPIAIFQLNLKGKVLFINKTFTDLLGYEHDDALKKHFSTFIAKKSNLKATETINYVVSGKPIRNLEIVFKRKDGTEFIGYISAAPFKKEGKIVGLHAFITDLSQLKEAEKELRLLNEISNVANSGKSRNYILNKIAKIISEALQFQTTNIYLYNSGDNYITLTSMSLDSRLIGKIEKLSGLKLLNLKIPLYEGSGFTELIQKKQSQLQDDPVRSIKDYTDKPVLQAFSGQIAKIIRFKSGIRVPLMIDGKIIGIIGVTSDKKYTDNIITSLERFATALSSVINRVQIDESLRASEEKFRAVSTTATDGIIILNEKAETTFWNDAAYQIFGYTSEESLGKDLHTIIAHERYYEDYKKGFAKYTKTGKGPLVGGTRELMALRKDGTEFPMEISMSAFKSGGKWNAVRIIRDITERNQEAEKYRTLFESSSDALMVLSEKGFIDGNRSVLDIFGIKSKEEFLLTQPWELSPPRQPDGKDSKEKARLMIEIAHQSGSNRFKWIHRRKNGKDFPAEVLLNSTTIANENVIQATVIDITERQQKETELLNKQVLNDKIYDSILELAKEKIDEDFNLQDYVDKILKSCYLIFNHDRLSVWLPNEKGFYISAYMGKSENPEGLDFLSGIEFSEYIKFMKANHMLISNDVSKDKRLNELRDYFKATGTLSMLDSSAIVDNEMIAIFCNERSTLHNWASEEIGFMRSISEQFISVYLRLEERKSQIKLEESELKLNRFFNFAPAGIAINHMDGKFSEVNVEFTRITGYTTDELNQLSYWDLTPEKYAKEEEVQLKSIAERKAYGPYEKEYIRKDGTIVPVLLKGIILESGGEDFIWSVVEDITDRKVAEGRAESIATELIQLIDNANAPIFGIDRQGNVSEWNKTAEKITGFNKEEVMGRNLIEEFITEDYRVSVSHVMNDALKGKETTNYEFPLFTKDRKRVLVLLNSSTRRDLTGEIVGVLGVGQDITELVHIRTELTNEKNNLARRIEERTKELSISNAELARAARMKDEFLANMSHELRTPLNSILGLSEALQEEVYGSLNQKQLKSLNNIETSGKHLLSLINEILDLAKIEAGKIELQYGKISIDNLVQSSLVFIKQTAFKKQLKVTSSISSAIEYFSVDEKRMKQILVNLLSNAVKFTPEGGEVALDVAVHEEDNKINFCVKDTGIGISGEDMEQLFTAFVQIDSGLSRKYEGTGLGLALVKSLAELHNGAVSVESVVNKGSSFTVSIPLLQEDEPAGEMKKSDSGHFSKVKEAPMVEDNEVQQQTQSTTQINESKPLILLADDNEANVETVTDYLEAKQFRVIVARNGKEAVESVREMKPELILMDIQMPVMDGLEATKEIRASKDPEISSVPIIALTALAMPGDEKKCMDAGTDKYMKKPVGLKHLVKTINDLLEQNKNS